MRPGKAWRVGLRHTRAPSCLKTHAAPLDVGMDKADLRGRYLIKEGLMKRHWPSVLWGTLGLVAGFTICYFSLVPPKQAAPVVVMTQPAQQHHDLEWRPQKVLPVFPPKIAGH